MMKPVHIVIVSTDPSLHSKIQSLGDAEIILVKDLHAASESATTKRIDVLLLGEGSRPEELAALQPAMDLTKTVVLAGPLPPIEAATTIRGLLENGNTGNSLPDLANVTLEDYVESKFRQFVRAMKASSARSLYATLIQAVERPLIELALRETHGNQIQAAQLLGLNRNTLRKKISECKISVKRRSRSHREKEVT
ncbi:helix-turn-helix domain-containing protein [Candidatus Nitronereus thalassa]|uniref:Helix-turn-helix domain-containing protein n=1 Tax=Candidatus Nitronereus thalassa TaxID=3020898 RepID=A0ABU3K9K9_9BACT|nr:helix-turn-helix domain-containing protein [Candidatus Nitronereus thalassa]MDT7043081.1 helix-turn-helix domain-containing protein [Candidatus Nitronereus thalassa]